MAWSRGRKPHGYVLVQEAGLEEYAENAISHLMDMSDIRQLVCEGWIHHIVLP
jgi:hypothetical protein